MRRIKNFEKFLLESKVKLDKELREYSLTHKTEALFQVKSRDFFKEFSVKPYNSESLKALPSAQKSLEKAIETLDVNALYSAITKAEAVPYDYSNVFTSKFSLKGIAGLSLNLEPEQSRMLNSSEKEFLMNDFSSLNKETKDLVIAEMRDRAEILCVIIESLFYYVRSIDTENFYGGINEDEIVKSYEEEIEKASKEVAFSYEGPFSDISTKKDVKEKDEKAYWLCEKNTKKFVISAVISPKKLHSEENVTGEAGLKFSILKDTERIAVENFNSFNIADLSSRIAIFYDKILKKK